MLGRGEDQPTGIAALDQMGENHRLAHQFDGVVGGGHRRWQLVQIGRTDGEGAVFFDRQIKADFMAQAVGQLGKLATAGRAEEIAWLRGRERWIEYRPAAAGQVCLDPGVLLRFGEQCAIVDRIGRCCARRDVTACGRQTIEHAGQQRLCIRLVQRAEAIGGGNAAGTQQSNQQAGLIDAVAGFAPKRPPCAPQTAGVRFVAQPAHELK